MPENVNINGAGGVGPIQVPKPPQAPAGPAEAGGKSFADYLDEKIGEVDQLQHGADQAIQDLASGKEQDINTVVTAVEKANLAFQMMVQIRNKLVDAYQEIMRIRT